MPLLLWMLSSVGPVTDQGLIAARQWRQANGPAILAEYREAAPPSTDLGRAEAEWADDR